MMTTMKEETRNERNDKIEIMKNDHIKALSFHFNHPFIIPYVYRGVLIKNFNAFELILVYLLLIMMI